MDFKELKNIFNSCELKGDKIIVTSNLPDIVKLVKEKYGFDILTEIIAIDNQPKFELLYRLYSKENNEFVTLSTTVTDETDTVTDIFPSAIADENEIYDLFGIKFIGNQNLKRLYMPESWNGYPLRKDYKEDDERLGWNEQN